MAEDRTAAANRPHVWVNCAVSLDGRLAFAGGVRARLSGPEDLARVHRLRAGSDAILVGVGTVVADDPSLHVRWELVGAAPGPPPRRVVVDSTGRIPPHARVLDGSAPTTVATTDRNQSLYPPTVRRIVAGSAEVDFARLFATLRDEGVERLMVEGGAEVLSSVLRPRLFDRLTIYYAPVVIGGRTAPPMVTGPETAGGADLTAFSLDSVERLGDGFVAAFVP